VWQHAVPPFLYLLNLFVGDVRRRPLAQNTHRCIFRHKQSLVEMFPFADM